jgi:hypothetical protein
MTAIMNTPPRERMAAYHAARANASTAIEAFPIARARRRA